MQKLKIFSFEKREKFSRLKQFKIPNQHNLRESFWYAEFALYKFPRGRQVSSEHNFKVNSYFTYLGNNGNNQWILSNENVLIYVQNCWNRNVHWQVNKMTVGNTCVNETWIYECAFFLLQWICLDVTFMWLLGQQYCYA